MKVEYLFTSKMISQETKPKLTYDCTGRSSNFDCGIRGRWECTRREVYVSNHYIGKVDSKDIVRVGITKQLTIFQIPGGYNPTPATTIALFSLSMQKTILCHTEHDTKRIWHCPFVPRRDAYVPRSLRPLYANFRKS